MAVVREDHETAHASPSTTQVLTARTLQAQVKVLASSKPVPRRIDVCTRIATQVQRSDQELRLPVVDGRVVVVDDLDTGVGKGG
jgi:hypothetical protein